MTSTDKSLVFFKRWMAPVALQVLEERPDIRVTRLELDGIEEDNWRMLKGAHGYQSLPRTESQEQWLPGKSLIAKCSNMLAVCSAGAGYDVVDVAACTQAGIIVCNQVGTNKEAVAEHALGFMLSLSKKITYWDHVMRRIPKVDRFTVEGNDIHGKTVGIVGIGNIGGQLAKLCRAGFEMNVLAYDPHLSADEIAHKGARKVELDELLRSSDFVSLNCPLTDETAGIVGAREFALMKRTAYFVTTARGQVHDEAALVEALREGKIAGAGVDVFHSEPPPIDHPLMAFDNVVVTPHMGGITAEATNSTAAASARQWIEIFSGKVPPRLVNPEAWPKYCDRFERLLGLRPDPLTSAGKRV